MGRRRIGAALALGASAAAVVLGPACLDPTEVTLSVTTDEPCAVAGVGGTQIVVGPEAVSSSGTATPAAETTQCTPGASGQDNVIGTFVVTPNGDKGASFAVEAVQGVAGKVEDCAAHVYAGCIVARRELTFVPHTRVTVPVALRSACLGVVCPSGYSCNEMGTCSSDKCADPSCMTLMDAGVVDAIAPVDGAQKDATTDTGGPPSDATADAGLDTGTDAGTPPDATKDTGGDAPDVGSDAACSFGSPFTCGAVTDCHPMAANGCCGAIDTPSCTGCSVAPDGGASVALRCISDLSCSPGMTCCAYVSGNTLFSSCEMSCAASTFQLCQPGVCATCAGCTPFPPGCPVWLQNESSYCFTGTPLTCP